MCICLSHPSAGDLYFFSDSDMDDSVKDKDYVQSSSDKSDSDDPREQKQPKIHITADQTDGKDEKKNYTRKKEKKAIKGETREVRKNRKKLRNLGQSYVTRKGIKVREKRFSELPTCRMNCKKRIDDTKRKNIFEEFWRIGDYEKRSSYIAGLITTIETQTSRKKVEGKKHKNRIISNKFSLSVNGAKVPICKRCFMLTFDITNRFMTTVIKNKGQSICGMMPGDGRGKSAPANKTPEEDMELIRKHISIIPAYESHYTRKDSTRKYLPSHYTLKKCYDEYKLWLPAEKKPVSQKIYEYQFRNSGIKIKMPNKDTCATCDKLRMLIKNDDSETVEELKIKLQAHQSEADRAYEAKRKDKEQALQDRSLLVYTFDLQQCLPTPDLKTSIAFYKRQLWTFNFTMRNLQSKQCYCFMWHEASGGRGADQIASCIYKHFLSIPLNNVSEITLYSDTCAGQNKNSFVLIMFSVLMKLYPGLKYINHKFLVPGHTHMECDSDHSVIERKKKTHSIALEHPRDWIQLVKTCGSSHQPFQVTEMGQNDFFQFSALLKKYFKNQKKDMDGEKLSWRDVKWFRYSQDIGIVQYKTSLDEHEPFKKVNFLGKTSLPPLINPPLSYKGPLPISIEKKKNLIEMLPYIDQTFHTFYNSLITKNDVIDAIESDSSEGE